VVQILLSKGVDVNSRGGMYGNALSAAAFRDQKSTCNLLLAEKAQADISDHFGRTPLSWAAMGGHLTSVNVFWPTGCLVSDNGTASYSLPESTSSDTLGCTLLHYLAIGNCCVGMKRALRHGFEVNLPDSHGWTALHWAAYFGHEPAVSVLLDCSADTRLQDSKGWTPYKLAIFTGATPVVQLLSTSSFEDESTDLQQGLKFEAFCDSCTRVSPIGSLSDFSQFNVQC